MNNSTPPNAEIPLPQARANPPTMPMQVRVAMYLLFATSARHWFRSDEPEHV